MNEVNVASDAEGGEVYEPRLSKKGGDAAVLRDRTLDIPIFKQKKDQWCGAGATKTFLKVNHPGRIYLDRLARLIGATKEDGTHTPGIIRACRAYGQDVATKEQSTYIDLEQCLDERLPAMVSYLEPVDPDGHYSVVTGLSNSHIWLHDPYYGKGTKYKRSDFSRMWRYYRKWMMWPVWPDVRIQENLRFFKQKPGEWVGAGALLILLKVYQSRNMRAQELARKVGARRTDVLSAAQIMKIAKEMGQNVDSGVNMTRADLKTCLDDNTPSVICYRSPVTEQAQCAVVSGLSNTHIYIHDPNIGPYHEMHFQGEFLARWIHFNSWMMWPIWRDVKLVKPSRSVDVMKKVQKED